MLAKELRASVDERYRAPGRVEMIISFVSDIVALTIKRRIKRVPPSWYTKIEV